MRLLIIDPAGNGLDFAMRAQSAGHDVKMFIRQTDKTQHIGRGLVEVVDDFKKWLLWANLVFLTDNTFYLRDTDALREQGHAVIGATQESAQWELDRQLGMQMFRKAGIDVPPYRVFSDYDTAIAYVKRTGLRCVSKPSGDADKALSYCADTPADMIFMLERWKRLGKLKAPFILQEFIPGTEMAVGGWIGPDGFNEGWCENFEFKKLMNDDKGVATGEQGTVLRVVKQSKLARKVLVPLTDALLKTGHTGYVDVNCIVDDNGKPWPLEFTMRPGWPTFNIQQPLVQGDPVQWLLDLAQGKDARNWLTNSVSIGVVLSIPDYPYSHLTRKEVTGIPVYGLKPSLWQHVHPCEMMQAKDPLPMQVGDTVARVQLPVTAGDYVLVMTATGETVLEAKRRVYSRLKRLTLPNSPMYRTDIGDRLRSQLPAIQAKGYATGLTYSTTPAS